jgi:hypothetical protein
MVKPKQTPAKLGKLRTKPAKPAKPQAVVTLLEIVSLYCHRHSIIATMGHLYISADPMLYVVVYYVSLLGC